MITPDNFRTEWCYSGHFVIFPNFPCPWCYRGQFLNGKFQGALCYSGYMVNFNFKSPWCYSGQDGGVIKPRNVGVTATPYYWLRYYWNFPYLLVEWFINLFNPDPGHFFNFYKQRSVKVLAEDYTVDLKAQVQNSQILIIIPFCALRWAKRIGFCPY